MYIMGPYPKTFTGKCYIFTMQDRFSRWVEAVPIVACSAEALAKVFFNTWVVRYGALQVIVAVVLLGPLFHSRYQGKGQPRVNWLVHSRVELHPDSTKPQIILTTQRGLLWNYFPSNSNHRLSVLKQARL